MPDDLIALGKRAVACAGWRLMSGMLLVDVPRSGCGPVAYQRLVHCRPVSPPRSPDPSVAWEYGEPIPDFSDPATLGCLLALVREAWGSPSLFACDTTAGNRWEVYCPKRSDPVAYESAEIEALVAALEAAPTEAPDA